MENQKVKKESSGLVVLVIILFLVILGLGFYICYDKGIILSKNETKESGTTKKSSYKDSVESLDVNSRLVQYLYYNVSDITFSHLKESYGRFWYLVDRTSNENYSFKDLYLDKASEIVKMQILSLSLDKSALSYVQCDTNVPANLQVNGFGEAYTLCNNERVTMGTEFGYSKEYIEQKYKELYGKDSKIDVSVPIVTDQYAGSSYVYVKALDSYIEARRDVGGTSGPGGFNTKIVKAEKDSKNVRIYEEITSTTYSDDNLNTPSKVEKDTYVYTFSIDDDGMYSFVSRVKETK